MNIELVLASVVFVSLSVAVALTLVTDRLYWGLIAALMVVVVVSALVLLGLLLGGSVFSQVAQTT